MAETRTLKVVVVGNSKGAQGALRSLGVEGDKAGGKFGKVAGRVGVAAAGMAAGVAAAAGIAAKKMYEFGAPLERNLNVIKSLDPTATVSKMNSALEANAGKFAKMGVNTAEASSALVELVKAGMSSDDALAALQGTLQAAIGGGMELADAAGTVSNAINAFGLKASDAGQVSNILANAANVSSADVSDLAQSLSMASAVAAQAKVPFSTVNAMLVELANKGMKGSDAGTSLKTMLLHLTAPVGSGAKQLKKLGLSAFDAQGKIKSMPKIIDEFNKATAKMNDKQKAAAMSAIFGTDAIRAANIIFGAGSAKLNQYTKAVQRTGGAQKAAEARTGGLSGAFARLKSQAESGAAAMYMKVAPGLAKVVNGVADMGPKVKKALAPVAKNVVNAFKGIGGGGMGKELAATGGVLKKFAVDLLPVFREFGTKLMAVLGPGLKSIGDVIRTQFLPGVRAILPVLRPVVAFILQMLGSAVIGIVKGVILALKGAFQVIGGLFKLIAAVIHGDWSGAWKAVKTIFFGAINIIKGAILVWWNLGIIQVFRRGILKVVSGVKGFWSGLKDLFAKGTSGVKTIVGKIVDFLLAPFKRAFSGAKSYTSNGWAYIRGRFSAGVGGVKAVLGRIIEVITYPYRRAFALARSVISGGWSAITGLFSAGKTRVVGVVKAIPGLIKQAFTNPIGMLKGIGGNIVSGLVNGIKNGYQAVIGAVQGLIDRIPGPIRKALGIHSPSRVMASIGGFVVAGLYKGITGSSKSVVTAMSRLATGIISAFKQKVISKGKASALVSWLGRETSALNRLWAKRNAVAKRLSDTQARLKGLLSARAALAASVKDSVVSFGSLLGVTTTNEETGQARSASEVLADFQAKLNAAKAFTKNLAALQARGLSKALVQQIAEAGPDQAGALVTALTTASAAQIKSFNSTQSGLVSLGSSAGNAIAGGMYDAGINAAKGLVKGLESQAKSIDKAIGRMAKAIVKAMKRALGIHSPSRVFRALGGFTGQGFALGIADATPDAQSAVNALAAVRPGGASSAASAGLSGARAASVAPITVQVHVAGSVIKERELALTVRDELLKVSKRNGGRTGL